MKSHPAGCLLGSLFCLAAAWPLAGAPAADERNMPTPISVSSANYAETPLEKLIEYSNGRDVVDPNAPVPVANRPKQTYLFMPGEVLAPFPSYDEVCRRLEPALKQNGFTNAADGSGRVPKDLKIDLVLRVTYGQREWRVPAVRTRNLAFRDGLIPPTGHGRLKGGGSDTTAWDYHSGGSDNAIAAGANTGSGALGGGGAGNFGQGGGGISATSAPPPPGGRGNDLTDTRETREFNLIVIDAFDYEDLRKNGRSAQRRWSTFVAAPVGPGAREFAGMLDRMIRTAQSYFGSTTNGIQFYPDARAQVKIGEAVVVPDETKR